jgi:hypothetical protein
MRAASRPRTVCSMRGVCIAGSIAGWAHTKSSFRRSSGNCTAMVISSRALPEELNRWLARQDDLLVTHKIDDRVTLSRQ